MDDPQPPIEPEGLFDGLRAGAILLGALVDHVATFIATGLVVSLLAPDLMDGPLSQERADELSASTSFMTATLITGALCTVFAAFVGASRAGRLYVSHGGWVAVAGTALSLVYLIPSADPLAAGQPEINLPLWAEAIAWLAILPAGICGGLIARARAAKAD